MKVVIAGAGSVGRYMADQLQASGHAVTLVDQTPALVDRFGVEGPVTWYLGDACEAQHPQRGRRRRCRRRRRGHRRR